MRRSVPVSLSKVSIILVQGPLAQFCPSGSDAGRHGDRSSTWVKVKGDLGSKAAQADVEHLTVSASQQIGFSP